MRFFAVLIFVHLFILAEVFASDRIVSNLNDSGAGSLRDAISTDGPAKIIFKVSGDIQLDTPLELIGNDLILDGSTAPSQGIKLIGFGLKVSGSRFVIQDLRIWVGDRNNDPKDSPKQDGLVVYGDKNKPVKEGSISNCTIFAAVDEGISTYGSVSDVTFSRNMILWGLSKSHHQDVRNSKDQNPEKAHHSMAILVSEGSQRIKFNENLLALNRHRNPRVMPGATVGFYNNLVYGWGTGIDDGLFFGKKKGSEEKIKIAFVNNLYQAIPDSFLVTEPSKNKFPETMGSIFRTSNSSNFAILDSGNLIYSSGKKLSPFSATTQTIITDVSSPITESDFKDLLPDKLLETEEVFQSVINNSGAFVGKHDVLEKLILSEISSAKGKFIDSPKDLKVGYPY